MDSKAKLFILSSFMLDRKKVLISFNFEKLRSPEATVTGIVFFARIVRFSASILYLDFGAL